MRDLITDAGSYTLTDIARRDPLLVFDFDGTLAPIVDDPHQASLRPATHALLRLTALLYPCAVVSGRRRADLCARLTGIPLVGIVGNHGAEAGFGPVDRTPRGEVASWLELLAGVARLPGIWVEDKGLSIAVHYRHSCERAKARRAIEAATRDLPGGRVFGGRAVVNVVPRESHDKGDAVARLLQRIDRRVALYVGDDATDEDAFRNPCVVLGVRVGRTHRSAAAFYLSSQQEVDDLLRALVRARRALDGLGEDIEGLERTMAEVEPAMPRSAG
ncbi:MAG TPA: trehalose-phosphatase [Solirubrobacter sp.]